MVYSSAAALDQAGAMSGAEPKPTAVALSSDSFRNWPDKPERLGKLTLFAILTEVANTLLIFGPHRLPW